MRGQGTRGRVSFHMKSTVSVDERQRYSKSHRPTILWLCDDHLVRIFEYAWFSSPADAAHIRLSGVCRRFRAIIVRHMSFWTYLSPLLPMKVQAHNLERSRNEGIVVDLSSHKKIEENGLNTYRDASENDAETESGKVKIQGHSCNCVHFLEGALKHSERWTDLNFTLDHKDTSEQQRVTRLLRGLSLPSLKRLTLDSHAPKDHATAVCSSWSMPNLQRLTCNQHFATIVTKRSSPLTTLHLTVAKENGLVDPKKILEILGSSTLTTLTDLLLDFEGLIRGYPGGKAIAMILPAYVHDEEEIELPRVRNLTLKLRHAVAEDAVECILEQLYLPKLERLSVEIVLTGDFESNSIFRSPILHSYVPLFEWLIGPIHYAEFHPDPRDVFPQLRFVRIIVLNYDTILEATIKEELNVWVDGGNWTPKGGEMEVVGMKELLGVKVEMIMRPGCTN